MERNNIVKLKCSSINYLDIFAVGFNFLVDGRYKQKTMGGAILSLLYFFIFIGLFFGFGIDLYQRKIPKVSFNTVIKDYNEVSLSNKNFTCAYRVEDMTVSRILDESIIYHQVFYFKHILVDGVWVLDFYRNITNRNCRDLAFTKEKEIYIIIFPKEIGIV